MTEHCNPTFVQYHQRILELDPIAYWPLDEKQGLVAYDRVTAHGLAASRNGAHTGVTLYQPGIGDGRTSPFYDGLNDFTNVYTVSLRDTFNGSEGTMMIWARVANAGVWTDGTIRYAFRLCADGNNRIRTFFRDGVNNQVDSAYWAGGVPKSQTILLGPSTDWHCFAITWSASRDEVRHFIDGVQIGATANGLGVWAGVLNPNAVLIGAGWTTPVNLWHGYLAHAFVLDYALPPDGVRYAHRSAFA